MKPDQMTSLRTLQDKKWLPVVLLSALFVAVTFEAISLIVRGWFTFLASQGFLMFAVAVFMIWKKRQYLGRLKSQPSVIRASLLTSFGCAMLVAGRMTGTMSLEKISVLVILLGLVLHLGGPPYLRALYVPILYLVFTLSVFDTIFSGQLIYLQRMTAYIAAKVLAASGLSVVRNGTTILLPHIGLEVDTACSGINHIIALVALAIPLALVTQKTRGRRIILVLEAFFIGLLANGLRVAGIGLWTHFNRNGSVHGPLDVFLVTFVFGFGCVALVGLSILQGRISLKRIGSRSPGSDIPQGDQTSRKFCSGFISGAVILGLTGGYLFSHTIDPVYLKTDLNEIPAVVGNWVGVNTYEGTVSLEGIRPDSEFKRTYHNADKGRIHVYVGYFAKQDHEKKVFNSIYSSFKANAEIIYLHADQGVSLELNHRTTQRGDTYLGYMIDGQLISKPSAAKLASTKSGLLYGRTNAGIVIIETEGDVSSESASEQGSAKLDFIKEIVPQIVSSVAKAGRKS